MGYVKIENSKEETCYGNMVCFDFFFSLMLSSLLQWGLLCYLFFMVKVWHLCLLDFSYFALYSIKSGKSK